MESWDSRVSILGPQQRIFVCGENLFLAIWGRGGVVGGRFRLPQLHFHIFRVCSIMGARRFMIDGPSL